ncbi:hypothetical protein PN569_16880 [Parabacteroides merdae]|jgi:hypothetical protein|uniref:Uncharacterized protein n=3 Tax=Parabacteroides merdae TaxID=46503 RepID=A0AA37NGG6_9BACT|nr:hypothetical protein [Parabacteroides merdae]MCI7683450.1 hypothetical protein [Parabacteroides merdae]MDB8964656.1 hypothetical protein [Parabacteroides merdae]MDB8968154.1 hypothetical protein [Parabacteroides merdae]MDB8971838.1 hypothetical protein [Parabacteroides merdae]MDB8975695.1 hypothetical protein [Parabacteroides merdae]
MGSEEWEQERRNNFYDYKVKNREGFDMLSITPCAYNEDTAFLTGIKNEKMWIGMFDNHTKEQLKEWNGTKTVERTIKIDKGYGETELFNVTAFDFRSDIYKTNWGFTAALSYLHRENTLLTSSDIVSKDIFLLNGNEIIVYPLNYPAIANPYWFQGSIFVLNMIENCTYSIILSPDGKKIAEWKGNFVNGDFNPVPISYTEGIFIDRESDYFIIRYNYQTGKDVWKTSIPSLKGVEDNARINSTILEQSNPIWKYQIDITNYDGSKKQVIFTVDVETGEVTEI